MSNLLTKQALTEAKPDAILYAVWEGSDYHIALSTLLSLVTKASLGLGNVDNTSDEDKPVSLATQAALDQKANADDVVTVQAFQMLVNSLSNYVTTTQLNSAIAGIQVILDGKTTPQQVNSIVEGSINPVLNSLQTCQTDIAGLQSQIDQLELTGQGDVTTAQLNQVIARVEALENGLTSLSNAFQAHGHNANTIGGLQVYVENIVTAMSVDNVTNGTNDW